MSDDTAQLIAWIFLVGVGIACFLAIVTIGHVFFGAQLPEFLEPIAKYLSRVM